MAGFVAGTDRGQSTLLPECLDDWVDESNPIRVIDAFVDALDLRKLGFEGVDPAETGRPARLYWRISRISGKTTYGSNP
jgi:transposase